MTLFRGLWLGLSATIAILAQPGLDRWREESLAGASAMQSRDYQKAEQHFKNALTEAEKFGAADQRLAATLNNLALVYRSLHRYKDAAPLFRRSLALYEKALGPDAPQTGSIAGNLGSCLRAEADYSAAQPLLSRALAISEKQFGIHSLESARARSSLAMLYLRSGQSALAAELYAMAIRDIQELAGSGHPELPSLLRSYAASLKGTGKEGEARRAEAQATELDKTRRRPQ